MEGRRGSPPPSAPHHSVESCNNRDGHSTPNGHQARRCLPPATVHSSTTQLIAILPCPTPLVESRLTTLGPLVATHNFLLLLTQSPQGLWSLASLLAAWQAAAALAQATVHSQKCTCPFERGLHMQRQPPRWAGCPRPRGLGLHDVVCPEVLLLRHRHLVAQPGALQGAPASCSSRGCGGCSTCGSLFHFIHALAAWLAAPATSQLGACKVALPPGVTMASPRHTRGLPHLTRSGSPAWRSQGHWGCKQRTGRGRWPGRQRPGQGHPCRRSQSCTAPRAWPPSWAGRGCGGT